MSQVHNGYLRASKDLEHLHANPVYDFYYRNCSGSCDFRLSLADLSTSKLGSWGTEGTRIQRPLIWQVPIVIWPTYTSQRCDGNLQLPQPTLVETFGRINLGRGDFLNANSHFEQALSVRDSVQPANHPSLVSLLEAYADGLEGRRIESGNRTTHPG